MHVNRVNRGNYWDVTMDGLTFAERLSILIGNKISWQERILKPQNLWLKTGEGYMCPACGREYAFLPEMAFNFCPGCSRRLLMDDTLDVIPARRGAHERT